MLRVVAFAYCLLGLTWTTAGEVGKPVAISWWGQGMVSIESYWDLRVVIDPHREEVGYANPNLSADLVLVTHEHSDHNNVAAVKGTPTIVRGLNEQGEVSTISQTLDRLPGVRKPVWQSTRTGEPRSSHAIRVENVPAWHDEKQGADRGAVSLFVAHVDGVRIVHAGDLGQTKLSPQQVQSLGQVDVLCLPVGGVYTIDGPQAIKIIEQLKPRYVLPLHYKTDKLKIGLNTIEPFLAAVGDRWEVDRPAGNTLAVSTADSDDETTTRVVVLGYEPWKPADQLAKLLHRMETACEASQQVFAPLSATQLNWRPPNGSHTPRWNAEHMMGRQLGFFSQIYAAIDPEISAINLNPQQMPKDYQPAHPDWDGDEQARQMQRAAAFVRRFGYLLEGVDLDQRAPGSRWTLRRLLLQMQRHFNQHTANVKKKFDLAGWPAE